MNQWGEDGKTSDDYKEALGLIVSGQKRLAEQGRGEESDFKPVAAVEIDQQKRYDYFQLRAKTTRDAKQRGEKLNDLDLDKLLGASWRVD